MDKNIQKIIDEYKKMLCEMCGQELTLEEISWNHTFVDRMLFCGECWGKIRDPESILSAGQMEGLERICNKIKLKPTLK